jgi:hypothetical protein
MFNESDSGESAPRGPDHSLLCRVPGCGKRWSVDINHGRVCSDHDARFSVSAGSQAPQSFIDRQRGGMQAAPFRQITPPHWQDDSDRDAA